MALRGKFLYKDIVKNIKENKFDLEIGVYGIFDTEKMLWKYYILSFNSNSTSSVVLTNDICSHSVTADTYDKIAAYGKSTKSIQSGKEYCDEFKMKWETGSNDTKQELRDQKIKSVLEE